MEWKEKEINKPWIFKTSTYIEKKNKKRQAGVIYIKKDIDGGDYVASAHSKPINPIFNSK